MKPQTVPSAVTPVQRPRWKQAALPVGVTIATLIGLSYAVDTHHVVRILRDADPLLLGLAALKVPLQALFWTLRWYLIVRARRFQAPFSSVLTGVMIRSFFNNMTPGAGTGGEPIGAYYLSRRSSMSFKETMASTASERMCQGVVFAGVMLLAFLMVIPFLPLASSLIRTLLMGVGGFVVFIALMLYISVFQFRYGRVVIETVIRGIAWLIPPLKNRWDLANLRTHIDGWYQEFRAFMSARMVVLWITLFTVVNWWLDVMQPYFLFRALHIDVPFWLIVMNSTIVRVSGIFSLIPGGAGWLEGINVGLYTGLSVVPDEAIVAETILFRALDAWVLWLGSGLISAFAIASLTQASQTSAQPAPQ